MPNPVLLTAISGGIGSGKSVVSRMLRAMGRRVYDCDSEAKRLMDESSSIKQRLSREIHSECVRADGSIDRALISEIVFADAAMLARLNSIVHSAVRADIAARMALCASADEGVGEMFVETAILYQSGLNEMVDRVWEVTAPVELRIERVMKRNSLSRKEVEARILSQNHERESALIVPPTFTLINDGLTPLLPRVEELLESTAEI